LSFVGTDRRMLPDKRPAYITTAARHAGMLAPPGERHKTLIIVAGAFLVHDFETLRAKFLEAVFHHCPDAFQVLAIDGREGEITAHDWAVRFNVSNTWIEDWAKNA